MATDRRRRGLILGAAAALACPRIVAAATRAAPVWPAILTAWSAGGRHFVGVLRPNRQPSGVELPFRPHDVLVDPLHPGIAIAIARRPGDLIARVDLIQRHIITLFPVDGRRVTNGHAVFSDDGRYLLTNESDAVDGHGLVSIRVADSLEVVREFDSGGIGPHALMREPGGTLLVANGGILTLPDSGRAKLNLQSMDPSLVRLDARDGSLLGQWRLPDPRLSIRHLAALPDGRVAIALQALHDDEQRRAGAPPLALFDGSALAPAAAPGIALGGYGGDVAWVPSARTGRIFVSCTDADLLAAWHADGSWDRATRLPRAGALGCWHERLIASGARGDVMMCDSDGMPAAHRHEAAQWDNHLQLITAPDTLG